MAGCMHMYQAPAYQPWWAAVKAGSQPPLDGIHSSSLYQARSTGGLPSLQLGRLLLLIQVAAPLVMGCAFILLTSKCLCGTKTGAAC
jgi:hypothetical protein